jgi:hypothetical protein
MLIGPRYRLSRLPDPQKEKDDGDLPYSFFAVGSDGRDCFSTPVAGMKKGSGSFCRNGPQAASDRRCLTAFSSQRMKPERGTAAARLADSDVSPRTAENPDPWSGAPVFRHRWKTACHTSASLSTLGPARNPVRGGRVVRHSVPGNRPECLPHPASSRDTRTR